MLKVFSQFKGLKKEIYILFFGRLVTAMGNFIWPMLTFFLSEKLGIGDAKIAFIIGVSALIYIPAAWISGILADKFNRKHIIILFDLLSVIAFIVTAIIPFSVYSVITILIGSIFQDMEAASYDALIADFSTTWQREKAGTLEYLGTNIGVIFGSTFSGILFKNYTRLAFLLNGLAIFISTILIFLFVNMKNKIINEEEHINANTIYEEPVDENIKVLKVLKDKPSVLIFTFISCLIWLPATVYSTLLPLKLDSIHGLDGARIFGFLNGFNGFVVIAFTPLLSLILNKVTEIPKSFTGLILYGLGLIIFMITSNTYILFIGMFISTLGEISSVLGTGPYFSRRVPISHLGRVSSISNIIL